MKTFVIIELSNHRVVAIATFLNKSVASNHFDKRARKNGFQCSEVLALAKEAAGTLAIAADDDYTVQLIECETSEEPMHAQDTSIGPVGPATSARVECAHCGENLKLSKNGDRFCTNSACFLSFIYDRK